jgi:hypothetical protein
VAEMSKITSVNLVKVYEIDGKDATTGLKSETIEIRSHWCHRDRVDIVIGEKTVTVIGTDLKMAIENATNVGI